MFLRRQPARARRSLLVTAVAATVVLVPSVAWADTPTSPPDPAAGLNAVVGAVQGVVGNPSTTGTGTGSGTSTGTGTGTSGTGAATGTNQAPNAATAGSAPAVPSFDTSQLQALLTQLHVPASCASTVQADLTRTLTDLPTTLTNLVTQVVTTLSGSGQNPSAAVTSILTGLGLPVPGTTGTTTSGTSGSSSGVLIVDDLQQLIKDFLANCLPSTPISSTAPPSSAAPVAQQSVQTPAAAPAVQQPVSYPGYAPTGAVATPRGEPAGDAGLAALGGGVLLAGAAATAAARFRSRAARGGR